MPPSAGWRWRLYSPRYLRIHLTYWHSCKVRHTLVMSLSLNMIRVREYIWVFYIKPSQPVWSYQGEQMIRTKMGAGIAQWLEHRTRDWKVAGSNPCWNGGRIFFSRVDFLCWLLFRYPFHPRVTTVARKKSRSFCQKCRWQVTAKHAYTLRIEPCFGIGHSLSLICQMTSEDIKHQLNNNNNNYEINLSPCNHQDGTCSRAGKPVYPNT